jgi:cytochrome c peroxidase
MKNKVAYIFIVILMSMLLFSCRKKGCTNPVAVNYDSNAKVDDGSCVCDNNGVTAPTPYTLNIPSLFSQYLPAPNIPTNNPLTVQGVDLGKKLFFDPILSGDNTLACSGCHSPEFAFDDSNRFSTGIDFIQGTRNAMPIMNHAWNYTNKFFWDGRAIGLEEQAFGPVVNPVEMHENWPNAVAKLQAHPDYPTLFQAAFGTITIDSVLVVKALAQYERTLISGNSKFDRFLQNIEPLTTSELSGFNIFMDEAKGDCFHCHGEPTNPLWTDNGFHNNGLDVTFLDNGLGDVTNNPADNGKFKSPTLRNLIYTAPYMHDGRFSTIDEVIEHYSTGLQNSPTIDPLMKKVGSGGVNLTPQEKADLKAFLLTLTDSSFINDNATM